MAEEKNDDEISSICYGITAALPRPRPLSTDEKTSKEKGLKNRRRSKNRKGVAGKEAYQKYEKDPSKIAKIDKIRSAHETRRNSQEKEYGNKIHNRLFKEDKLYQLQTNLLKC